jgi:hypothetical protein
MVSRSPEETREALATIEGILASLRREADPDQWLCKVIQAVEDKRAELVAALLEGRAPEPTSPGR